jgi:hypothetical protein
LVVPQFSEEATVLQRIFKSEFRYILAIVVSIPIASYYVNVPQFVTWTTANGFPYPLVNGMMPDFVFWAMLFTALQAIPLWIAKSLLGREYAVIAMVIGSLAGPYVFFIIGGAAVSILSDMFGPITLAEAIAVGLLVTFVGLAGFFLWLWRVLKPEIPLPH